jgi:hypothetical protein
MIFNAKAQRCKGAKGRPLTILLSVLFAAGLFQGCAVSNHGVFPKLVWYWSVDAQLQRQYDAESAEKQKSRDARKRE